MQKEKIARCASPGDKAIAQEWSKRGREEYGGNVQTLDELSSKISTSYNEMSPNFRKIASFLLEHPDEVAMSSTREIAGQLEMDPSNLVRFAQGFSFSGFPEMKGLFQKRIRKSKTGYLERAQQLQWHGEHDEIAKLLFEVHAANSANLLEVLEQNNPDLLAEAGALIMGAKKVYICGFRSCFPAAFALHYICRMVRGEVYLSDGLGGTFADDMRGIGEGDVFVTIGMEPYSNNTVAAVRYAEKCGARILALTDSPLSPLAAHAHLLLTFGRKGPPVLGSVVPVIALVEALTTVMIAKGGEKALSVLSDSEKQLTEFAAYVDQPTTYAASKFGKKSTIS